MIGPLSVFACNIIRSITGHKYPAVSDMKHRCMIKYLTNEQESILRKYHNIEYSLPSAPSIPKIVWTLWYSEENMPQIVQLCLSHMKSSLKPLGYEVRILNSDNISNWVNMDDIQQFMDKKKISIQFFSDILRARLLAQYGGFWMDSTIAILRPEYINDIQRNVSFFTLRNDVEDNWCVSGNRWTSYFWATCPDNPIFSYLNEALTDFLKTHGCIFEYLHIDYTLATGYANLPFMMQIIDDFLSTYPTPSLLTGLMAVLNKPFSEKDYLKLCIDSPLQKLTYREWNPKNRTEDGEETYWNHISDAWATNEI